MPDPVKPVKPAEKPKSSRKFAYSIVILLIIVVAVYFYYSRFIVKLDKDADDDDKINKKEKEIKNNHIDNDEELKQLTHFINNRPRKNEQLPGGNPRAR